MGREKKHTSFRFSLRGAPGCGTPRPVCRPRPPPPLNFLHVLRPESLPACSHPGNPTLRSGGPLHLADVPSRGATLRVLVKWKGRSYLHATWQTPESLTAFKGACGTTCRRSAQARPHRGLTRAGATRCRPSCPSSRAAGYKKVENFVRKVHQTAELLQTETKSVPARSPRRAVGA